MCSANDVVPCACAAPELVEDLRSLKQQAAQLRPLHAALTQQFVEVYGAEGAGDLAGKSRAAAAGPASAAAASSSAAAMADADSSADAAFGGSSVTQQINLATLRAQQADEPELTAAIPAATASSGAAASAAPAAPTASSMNISEEAASDFF